MAYTGGWLANALYDRGTHAVHTADPAHADTSAATGNVQVDQAPPAVPVNAPEYPGSEWVVVTSGRVSDLTPETHTDGYAGGLYSSDVAMQQATGAAHSADLGASRTRNTGYPPIQFSSETYKADRFEVPLGTAVDPAALQRGLNGLPVNNPDGFRNGSDVVPWVDRKFAIGTRFHDAHVAEVNTAYVRHDIPVPAKAGPYNSPFNFLARAMTRINQTPMVRRDPLPIDEALVTDGTEPGQTYAPYSDSWVVG